MSKHISSHDAFSCISSELCNATTHIHLTIESHQEIINKNKHVRATWIGAHVNELKKINDAMSVIDCMSHKMMDYTGCKSYVNYTKKSNLAKMKDKSRNLGFLSHSAQYYSQNNNTNFK